MIRLLALACGGFLALLSACADSSGQHGQPTITATDSCVMIVFGGGNTGGTSTASPTTDVKIPLPGGLGLVGPSVSSDPAPAKGQSCTVSVTNATSPNGAVTGANR